MADETTIVEPTIDNHKTEEQSSATPIAGEDKADEAEIVENTEQEQEQEHTESTESVAESHDVTDAAIDPLQDEVSHEHTEETAEENAHVDGNDALPEGDAESEHEEHEHQEPDELAHENVYEPEHAHDGCAVEDEHDELKTAHDRLQEALADTEASYTTKDSRRSSTSSSCSGSSARRTSMRTEALIQAAARAVVAKINGHEAESDDFDIMESSPEPPTRSKSRQSARSARSARTEPRPRSEAAVHSTTDEEVDHECDGELGDDDVFSNRSHRTSLGSFEHNSGVSNNGSEYGHHQKDDASRSMAEAANNLESQTEHQDDYAADTGSISYHEDHRSPRMSTMSSTSKGPRISDVTGISHMSQYDSHHHDEDESYHDENNFIPSTMRGTPRPAFRRPSSVRAMQMSSPSPSFIFGVSPRSAARRRRVGTGEGFDEGQSMGSVATYSSLPSSPSKKSSSRFKVFSRPEPAPLVLLHATIMPTRWGWADVLKNFDEMMSHSRFKQSTRFDRKTENSLVDKKPTDLSSFEPSAALKRLHNAWCQLQEYSLGADTVTERGVLLPHPQNDFEVLEERLLEALELPVRRRARILECGHYLGPADVDDDDDEDYDCYDDENGNGNDEDSSSKRHWCSTCHSDIRYESLGAERVFRVKVYASNGLMTVGAWDACWREMERVDVEIEPIVADPALQRELNLLRSLQQKDAYHRQLEEERNAMHEEVEQVQEKQVEEEEAGEEQLGEEQVEAGQVESDDIISKQGDPHHDQHLEHSEQQDSRGAVDQFPNASPSSTPVAPALHDLPVEPPATTSTDHDPDADLRRLAAEDRLREIYGSTSPEPAPGTIPLSPQMEPTLTGAATPRTMHDPHLAYGPSPSFPSAEAYERRDERDYHQNSYPGPSDKADRGSEYGGPAPAYPSHPAGHNGNYHHGHPQHPYEGASFPELLMAAARVFLRDRKHVAITVLSVVVIILATLRAPTVSVDGTIAAAPIAAIAAAHEPVSVALTTATVFHTVDENPAARVVAEIDSQVETVVEKMTVKVYETVTETATEAATAIAIETSTETSAATATQAATAATTETADAESIESTPTEDAVDVPEATEASSAEEPEGTTKATEVVFAEAQQTCSAYEVVSVEDEHHDEL